MSEREVALALTSSAVARELAHCGFHMTEQAAHEAMTEVVAEYASTLGTVAVEYAAHYGRDEVCVDDVALALLAVGNVTPDALRSFVIKNEDLPPRTQVPPSLLAPPKALQHMARYNKAAEMRLKDRSTRVASTANPDYVPSFLPRYPAVYEDSLTEGAEINDIEPELVLETKTDLAPLIEMPPVPVVALAGDAAGSAEARFVPLKAKAAGTARTPRAQQQAAAQRGRAPARSKTNAVSAATGSPQLAKGQSPSRSSKPGKKSVVKADKTAKAAKAPAPATKTPKAAKASAASSVKRADGSATPTASRAKPVAPAAKGATPATKPPKGATPTPKTAAPTPKTAAPTPKTAAPTPKTAAPTPKTPRGGATSPKRPNESPVEANGDKNKKATKRKAPTPSKTPPKSKKAATAPPNKTTPVTVAGQAAGAAATAGTAKDKAKKTAKPKKPKAKPAPTAQPATKPGKDAKKPPTVKQEAAPFVLKFKMMPPNEATATAAADAPPPKRRASQQANKMINKVAKQSLGMRPPDNPEDDRLYCICRTTNEANLVACEVCGVWYHPACLEMDYLQISALAGWLCPFCDERPLLDDDYATLSRMLKWISKQTVQEDVANELVFTAAGIFDEWPKGEPGYLDTIAPRQKMDLRIIAKKLARNKYKSLAPFVDDLCTIVANCKKFNLPGSFYHVAADKLSGVIEKALGKYWPRRW